MKHAKLIFEDGTVFNGRAFTDAKDCFGEVVFNTAMSGYQEVLTDPSYCGQFVLMTYPLIGSYGINKDDTESRALFLSAFLVREYIDFPSNYRSTETLKSYLNRHGIMGVEGLDTRAITRHIRENGAQRAMITTSDASIDDLLSSVRASESMLGRNLVKTVSIQDAYHYPSHDSRYKIAVIDCGVKTNILRHLASRGCDCTVFPHDIDAASILNGEFDGVFVSNGPGDPEPLTDTVETIKAMIGKLPMFGICLGQQLIGLALGGKTYKLKFGHHGVNHPVKNLQTGQVEITSQNHGFCIDMDSLGDDIELTHVNLNDQTLEGFRHKTYPIFSVQYHPESAPGPHDSEYLFDDFISMIDEFQGNVSRKKEGTYVSR